MQGDTPARRRGLSLPQRAAGASPSTPSRPPLSSSAQPCPHLLPRLRPLPHTFSLGSGRRPHLLPRLRPQPPPSPSAPAAAPTFSLGSGHRPALQSQIESSPLPYPRSHRPKPSVATTATRTTSSRAAAISPCSAASQAPPHLHCCSALPPVHPMAAALVAELTPIPPPRYLLPLVRLRRCNALAIHCRHPGPFNETAPSRSTPQLRSLPPLTAPDLRNNYGSLLAQLALDDLL